MGYGDTIAIPSGVNIHIFQSQNRVMRVYTATGTSKITQLGFTCRAAMENAPAIGNIADRLIKLAPAGEGGESSELPRRRSR